jgi:hypothetical protein
MVMPHLSTVYHFYAGAVAHPLTNFSKGFNTPFATSAKKAPSSRLALLTNAYFKHRLIGSLQVSSCRHVSLSYQAPAAHVSNHVGSRPVAENFFHSSVCSKDFWSVNSSRITPRLSNKDLVCSSVKARGADLQKVGCEIYGWSSSGVSACDRNTDTL